MAGRKKKIEEPLKVSTLYKVTTIEKIIYVIFFENISGHEIKTVFNLCLVDNPGMKYSSKFISVDNFLKQNPYVLGKKKNKAIRVRILEKQ